MNGIRFLKSAIQKKASMTIASFSSWSTSPWLLTKKIISWSVKKHARFSAASGSRTITWMSWFLGFQQKVIDHRNSVGSSSPRLWTFEDKAELGTSWKTVFLNPSCVVCRMLMDYMIVEKKCNRNNKRMEVFILFLCVQKTGLVERLAILDVVDIEQRT